MSLNSCVPMSQDRALVIYHILHNSDKYRVSHIRWNTVRHERGCAACPLREQSKTTLRRLAVVKIQ
jgi:hypothetical protein